MHMELYPVNTPISKQFLKFDIDNKSTQSIRNLNDKIKQDVRVEHSLLSIYDGMTICYIK